MAYENTRNYPMMLKILSLAGGNLEGYGDEGYFAEQKIFLRSNYHYASNFHNVWTLFCDFDYVL